MSIILLHPPLAYLRLHFHDLLPHESITQKVLRKPMPTRDYDSPLNNPTLDKCRDTIKSAILHGIERMEHYLSLLIHSLESIPPESISEIRKVWNDETIDLTKIEADVMNALLYMGLTCNVSGMVKILQETLKLLERFAERTLTDGELLDWAGRADYFYKKSLNL